MECQSTTLHGMLSWINQNLDPVKHTISIENNQITLKEGKKTEKNISKSLAAIFGRSVHVFLSKDDIRLFERKWTEFKKHHLLKKEGEIISFIEKLKTNYRPSRDTKYMEKINGIIEKKNSLLEEEIDFLRISLQALCEQRGKAALELRAEVYEKEVAELKKNSPAQYCYFNDHLRVLFFYDFCSWKGNYTSEILSILFQLDLISKAPVEDRINKLLDSKKIRALVCKFFLQCQANPDLNQDFAQKMFNLFYIADMITDYDELLDGLEQSNQTPELHNFLVEQANEENPLFFPVHVPGYTYRAIDPEACPGNEGRPKYFQFLKTDIFGTRAVQDESLYTLLYDKLPDAQRQNIPTPAQFIAAKNIPTGTSLRESTLFHRQLTSIIRSSDKKPVNKITETIRKEISSLPFALHQRVSGFYQTGTELTENVFRHAPPLALLGNLFDLGLLYQRTNGEGVVQSASACWLSVEGFQNWEGKCFCLTATFNETGKPDQMELYHLFMTEKKQSEIREEYLDLIQYQKDFPPLNNEKSNPKIREIWPDGSYIESKNLTSVVIRHPKWDGQNVPCRVFVFLTPTKK